MTHLLIKNTVDAYPGMSTKERQRKFIDSQSTATHFERHVAFLESIWGALTDALYKELLKIHLAKEILNEHK